MNCNNRLNENLKRNNDETIVVGKLIYDRTVQKASFLYLKKRTGTDILKLSLTISCASIAWRVLILAWWVTSLIISLHVRLHEDLVRLRKYPDSYWSLPKACIFYRDPRLVKLHVRWVTPTISKSTEAFKTTFPLCIKKMTKAYSVLQVLAGRGFHR